MPIDLEYEERTSYVRYEVLRRWDMAGHEIMLVQCRFLEENGSLRDLDRLLICECDFDYEEEVKDGKVIARVMRAESRKCGARRAVVESVRREAWERYGAAWTAMAVDDAVMDVFTRHHAGEYLGPVGPESLYAQDVADIIRRNRRDVFEACTRLRDGRRLKLWGWILVPK